MEDDKKRKIIELVLTFLKIANINLPEEQVDRYIAELTSLNIDDSIDAIIVKLSELVSSRNLTEQDILDNVNLITGLNPKKYKNEKDLIERLKFLKAMNLEHPRMPLKENHKLVLEVLDKLNDILPEDMDYRYTGGILAYLSSQKELSRYHSDLDLFVNEEEIMRLKKIIDSSKDFKFHSNMDTNNGKGHEYKLIYKDTPMSVGLFLFERDIDDSVITKEYYYDNENQLIVDETHLCKEFSDLTYSANILVHNGIAFKSMSLEAIYDAKSNGRPKDRYDAKLIEDRVDKEKLDRMQELKKNNYRIDKKIVKDSIVIEMEKLIKSQKEEPQRY